MLKAENQVLNFIKLSQTSDWNIKQIVSQVFFSSKYDKVSIGKCIKRIKSEIKVQNDTSYKRLTIKTKGGGVFVRDEQFGKDIKTKSQYLVSAGQLAVSKIDARNGAFGIVPTEAEGSIITGNFWVFDINTKVVFPQYLVLLLSSAQFIQAWLECSNGSGNRLYLQESKFLNYKIPLPSIPEQLALLDKYNASMKKADDEENKCQNLKNNIDFYLLDSLGVQINSISANDNKLIFVSHLRDMSRWDMWTQKSEYVTTKYRFSKFSSVVLGKPLYGANEKAVKEKSNVRYLRITDINEDGSLGNEFVSAKKVEEKYLLENNDFLIARSGNTVGKTFLYKSEIGKCIFAGYLVRYKLNESKILPEYLLEYTKSSIFKSWISNNQRIFGQPNINGQEYLNADIIIPPLETQKEIVKNIASMKLTKKALRKEAESLRQRAKKEFEEAMFG